MNVVIRATVTGILFLTATQCPADERPEIGRFDVVPVDDKAILIDTVTGDTWLLEKSPSADNKSGHIWQKIPSPFDTAAPADAQEQSESPTDSAADQAVEGPPGTTTALAVRAEEVQPDENSVVHGTTRGNGQVFRVEKRVGILPETPTPKSPALEEPPSKQSDLAPKTET